ncbi:MAG: hypothetical protein EPN21_04720, partial [Methylococcaceae bacterium]
MNSLVSKKKRTPVIKHRLNHKNKLNSGANTFQKANAMNSVIYAARRALTGIIAGSGIVLCASVAQADSNSDLSVNFAVLEYYPALKSKIGFARAMSNKSIPDTLPYLQEMKPAIFCSEVDFDDVEEPNYALQPYPIRSTGKHVSVDPASPWFMDLQSKLKSENIKMLFQIIGAPTPFQQPNIKRPAIHPMPTDVRGAAEATRSWIANYQRNNPILWSIWNEPVHTLAGPNLRKAAAGMIDIYTSYFNALDPVSDEDELGLASFIAASVHKGFDGRPFIEQVIQPIKERMKYDRSLRIDFLTLNSYFGKRDLLVAGARRALGVDTQTTPIIFSQYAPEQSKHRSDGAPREGTVLNATRYLTDIAELLQETDVEHVCLSYWVGNGDKAFLKDAGTKASFTPSAHYHAVKFYMDLPIIRSKLNTSDNFINGIAARDYKKAGVLLWNDAPNPRTVRLNLSGIPASILKNNPMVKIRYLDAKHGSPAEDAAGATPLVLDKGDLLQPNATIDVQLAGPGIALVTVESKTVDDPLLRNGLKTAKFIRSLMFANRERSGNGVVPNGNIGAYDSVRDIAYLGLKDNRGAAYAGAGFTGLPGSIYLNYRLWQSAGNANNHGFTGVRVDYYMKDQLISSIAYHTAQHANTPAILPWGNLPGIKSQIIVEPKIGSGKSFELNMAKTA